MKNKYSVHHLIPTWAWGPNIPINKKTIKDTTHVNWHRIFDSKSPVQQLIHVLTFNEQILSKKFVKDLIRVLDKYIYDYYKVNLKIQSELWELIWLEQEYFSTKK